MADMLECEQEQQDGQPLLPSEREPHKNSIKMKDDTTILSGSFTFNAGPRPYRDSIFTFLFLGTIFTTYGFGLFAFTHADFNLDSKVRHSKFNRDTNQCDLVQFEEHVQDSVLLGPILLPILLTEFCVLVMTIPFGMLFLWLLHRYTRGVLLVAALLVPLLPLAFGLTWCYGERGIFTVMAFPLSARILITLFPLAMSGLLVYNLWKNWSRGSFESIVQVLKTATHALLEHFFVLILNPILFLGSMVLVNGPICTFIWYAFNNGKIVPNFDDPFKGCDREMGYPCCKEEAPEWVAAYVTLACSTLIWVTGVTFQLQILIVSSTAAQWYSTPECSSTFGIIKRSLRNAFGPSFGTACNVGTMVTTLVVELLGSELLKKMASRLANGNRQGMIAIILSRCFSWTAQFSSECQSRFASNFSAISGESFWVSSMHSKSLLRRNSLPIKGTDVALRTVGVLLGMVFTYVFLQAILVYGVLEHFTNSHSASVLSHFNTIFVGVMQFFIAILTVIDTLYICFAIEKDVGTISKPEVCHVYMLRIPPSQSENGSMLAAPLAFEDKV